MMYEKQKEIAKLKMRELENNLESNSSKLKIIKELIAKSDTELGKIADKLGINDLEKFKAMMGIKLFEYVEEDVQNATSKCNIGNEEYLEMIKKAQEIQNKIAELKI